MATINVGGGHGGKKSLDSEIPLVPFIDLLLCCVMFLLVTAVWNKLARINANQQQPGQPSEETPPPEEDPKQKLYLQVLGSGFVLASTAEDKVEIAKKGTEYDFDGLRKQLKIRHDADPNRSDIIIAPEDGVAYENVVATMDMAVGEGFADMGLSDSTPLMEAAAEAAPPAGK